jgi:predicted Zn-dependent protease
MTDEDHGSVVLRSHYAGLRKVFDGWLMPRDPATHAVAKNMEAVDAHYQALSKRFGFDIAPPEPLVNQLGYDLMGNGKLDEAISVFERNAKRYPASANVYDSLAEAYEKKGQLDLAVTNYAKAVSVAEKDGQPSLEVFRANLERVTKQKQSAGAPN